MGRYFMYTFQGGLEVGWDVNRRDQAWVRWELEKESTRRDDWNLGAFLG